MCKHPGQTLPRARRSAQWRTGDDAEADHTLRSSHLIGQARRRHGMFVETVDAKGFSAAGRRLNLATSSVTRALDGLEASLGAVLLNRSTRLITVTEAGAAYYQRARRILDAVEEADALIADRGEEPVGQLRVSLPVAFGRRCIAPYLGRWLAKHPQLEVEVTLTDDIVDLLGPAHRPFRAAGQPGIL